jgi:phosphatidylglycerophosphatase A
VIRAIVTVGYVGLLRPAPGTWGSLAGLGLGWLIHGLGHFPALIAATFAVTILGLWAVERATRDSADKDPGEIVIDEVAGIWLAMSLPSFVFWSMGLDSWTFPWPALVACFVFFRLFDIWKPGPVGAADRRGDAAGVMYDDLWAGVMAGVCTLIGGALWHMM